MESPVTRPCRLAAEPAKSSKTAHRILFFALFIHALIFVRIAVVHAPYLTYRGPSGADRVFYYAYVRSLVIDGDLDFDNDLALHAPSSGLMTVNGKQINKKPIGSPLLAVPLFALTHLAVLTLDRVGGSSFATDGFSTPYVLSYVASQMFFVLLGMWLLYRALLRYFSAPLAALAVVGAWFSTNAIRWSSVDLMMPHAAAQFSIAWCSFESVRLKERSLCWRRWLRLGISFALVVMVRYQNAVFAIVPAAAALTALKGAIEGSSAGRLLTCLSSGAGGFAAGFVPQLLVWRVAFGSWLTNSYSTEPKLDLLATHLVEVLTNPPISGLSVWLPGLSIGVVGCFALAYRRRDVIAFASGLAWLAHLYVISCWHAWSTLVERCPFDFNFPICLGFGCFLSTAGRRSPRAALIALSLLVAWNVPLAATTPTPVFPFGWTEGVKTLSGISKLSRCWRAAQLPLDSARPELENPLSR